MTSLVNVSYANSNMSDHHMASTATDAESTTAKKQEATIKLDVVKLENKNNKKLVQIRLISIKDNKPVTLYNLKEVHTGVQWKKLHFCWFRFLKALLY